MCFRNIRSSWTKIYGSNGSTVMLMDSSENHMIFLIYEKEYITKWDMARSNIILKILINIFLYYDHYQNHD